MSKISWPFGDHMLKYMLTPFDKLKNWVLFGPMGLNSKLFLKIAGEKQGQRTPNVKSLCL